MIYNQKRRVEPHHGRKFHGPLAWDDGEPLGERPYTNRIELEKATERFLILLTLELINSVEADIDAL